MTRRTATLTTAAVLLVALVCVAFLLPVPYVTMRPGPTRDVLAMGQGKAPVISIEGRRTYPTDGSLRLTTVSVTSPDDTIGIGEAFQAWLEPAEAVVPRDAVYPEEESAEQSEQESATQMAASQEVAAAAALRLLGESVPEHVQVLQVIDGAPAEGELRPGDVIIGVDGKRLSSARAIVGAIRDRAVGDEVGLVVRRNDSERTLRLPTIPGDEPDPQTGEDYPTIGIRLQLTYELPLEVKINLPGSIGGPSAGTVFALGIYDELTEGSLTGGRSVAGTGEILANGTVLPIGGVQQKMLGAVDAGAEVFLVPAENCAEAAEADLDGADLQLVRVDDLGAAVDALDALAEDPEADVSTCE